MSARIYVTDVDYDREYIAILRNTVQHSVVTGTRIGAKVYTDSGYLDIYARVSGEVKDVEETIRRLLREAVAE
ncbi:hypothetical protein [Paenibacillus polymyxa]|uniref:hypothetical protein n=1 Tax=Paenibacillus polymyxa TaxID=1406 RepID=UPI0006C5C1A5|nr:hypothetical protein [Paenibacillus polymyxa]KOS03927.1 hypothetical protein AM598_03925 [Paenibacillus polymyxa]